LEYLITFGKALGMFGVGIIAFRLMGSQAVGRLTDFDLVVTIAIGALIGAPLADKDLNPLIAVVAIFGLVTTQIIISWLSLKNKFFEKLITGDPIQLIKNGKIIINGLRRARFTKKDLDSELRLKGLKMVAEVEEAYIEPGGKLSIIPKKN